MVSDIRERFRNTCLLLLFLCDAAKLQKVLFANRLFFYLLFCTFITVDLAC